MMTRDVDDEKQGIKGRIRIRVGCERNLVLLSFFSSLGSLDQDGIIMLMMAMMK